MANPTSWCSQQSPKQSPGNSNILWPKVYPEQDTKKKHGKFQRLKKKKKRQVNFVSPLSTIENILVPLLQYLWGLITSNLQKNWKCILNCRFWCRVIPKKPPQLYSNCSKRAFWDEPKIFEETSWGVSVIMGIPGREDVTGAAMTCDIWDRKTTACRVKVVRRIDVTRVWDGSILKTTLRTGGKPMLKHLGSSWDTEPKAALEQ